MFFQRCPGCTGVLTASFCDEETCGRKFLFFSGQSHSLCPLHERHPPFAAASRALRLRSLERASACPRCGWDLFRIARRTRRPPASQGRRSDVVDHTGVYWSSDFWFSLLSCDLSVSQ